MAKCPSITTYTQLRQPWPPSPSASSPPTSSLDSNRGHATAITSPGIDSVGLEEHTNLDLAEDMTRHKLESGKNKNENDNTDQHQHQTQPEHEIHIWTERERRKKMRNMFSNLHSLLPHLPPKADKSTIVDEAISYIRSLQRSLHLLQTQKIDREARGAASASASAAASGCGNLEFEPMVGGGAIFNHSHEQPGEGVNLEGMGVEPWTSQPTLCPAGVSCHFQTWASPNVVLSVCGEDAHIAVMSTPPKQGLLSAIIYILDKHKLDVVTAHISSHNCRSMYMIHAHVNGHAQEYLESTPSCEEAFKSAIGELMFYL